jgi:energy-coupling factor transporter ATP-binding protein EcfA2
MYDLHSLGWFGFQELCNSIAREVLGQTAMAFLESADGGRDGCFSGKWQNASGENYNGEFVIQCKFKTRRNENLKFADVQDEINKIQKLVDSGLCDTYILMTNAGVSAPMAAKIQKTIKDVGVKYVFIYGSTWINCQIRESPNLRRLVPRVYGLGDLSEILDDRVYEQGKALLEYLKDELAKVVITSSFKSAANAIEKHSFVLLIGEAASGKTTIASLLAMGSLDQWKAITMKLETAEQVVKHWNPNNPMQFFWIDDAFGVTQYESALSNRWNQAMPKIVAMLDKGAKIVMTSRDYIFNDAKKDLKKGAFPLLHESQVVVDVQKLTLTEKRQILYNHLKMGKQPLSYRKEIKPYLEYVANHERFIPEMARRLSDPFFTKNLYLSEYYLNIFIQKQESFLLELISELDKDNQAALALIYMNSEKLKSPLELNEIENNAISKIGSSLSGCINALEAMRGNMVQHLTIEDESIWRFKHPTIGDAFAKHIVHSPDMVEIYIHGSSVDQLLEHITCGDRGVKNAIIIPKKLFSLILEKLNSYKSTKMYKDAFNSEWGAKRNLFNFLARRCTSNFLKLYIENNSEILEQVTKPSKFLDYSPEVSLAITLHSNELLPNEKRKDFISKVSEYAISGENLYVLSSDDLKEMFIENEYEELLKRIQNELIPKIPELKETWKARYDKEEDAGYHMLSLKENLEAIEYEFSDQPSIVFEVNKELMEIEKWITENTEEESISEMENLSGETEEQVGIVRSIFDDVDI